MPDVSEPALIDEIAAKESDKAAIALKLIRAQADLTPLLDGLSAKPAAAKFGCAKVLQIISEKDPSLVYPHFERIALLLDSENHILKWSAIRMLGSLAAVDAKGHFRALFDHYYGVVTGPELIAAAEVVRSSPKIARAFPDLADRITSEILKVQKAKYKTPECRNVAIGHALSALEAIYDLVTGRQAVLNFVKKQVNNPRHPVAAKAGQALIRLAAADSRVCGSEIG